MANWTMYYRGQPINHISASSRRSAVLKHYQMFEVGTLGTLEPVAEGATKEEHLAAIERSKVPTQIKASK